MTDIEYREKAKYIWKTYVPSRGQADCVQGELLRAISKLEDEAQRNGNINWDEGHEILAQYILDTLLKANIFDDKKLKQLQKDIKRILNYKAPYTEDDLYARITHLIVDFFIHFPEPIKHKHNIDLDR